ncbi:hypothetical protein CBOM_07680 [Ceraceosorus bombacis]|uniref:Uncharacterized protein n=1 Tax=Ceraceosorus bombacis TaxID=401625 RepID=A0A0P1BAZ8_9BASI|nr:hypothetical protein CBOM_07680 [Ceraceosorus bombacis]
MEQSSKRGHGTSAKSKRRDEKSSHNFESNVMVQFQITDLRTQQSKNHDWFLEFSKIDASVA